MSFATAALVGSVVLKTWFGCVAVGQGLDVAIDAGVFSIVFAGDVVCVIFVCVLNVYFGCW